MTAVTVIQRAVVLTPVFLSGGMRWTDSSSTSGCSGSIPAIFAVVHNYHLLGETKQKGLQVLVVERVERTSFTASGSQGQHRITMTGTGTGLSLLHLDPRTGQLVASERKHQSEVTLISSGRQQKFRQVVRETTILAN